MLSVAVLTSNRAPGLESLRHHPLRGSVFDIACMLTRRPPRDLKLREAYDAETARLLEGFEPDIVLLLGYLFIVTEPLLLTFPDRILNIRDGTTRYPGLHATRDAIIAGETATYSVVHLVTPDLDRGPVIVRSEPLPVATFVHRAAAAGEIDIVRAYAYAHREWMMRSVWGELAAEALLRVPALVEAAV